MRNPPTLLSLAPELLVHIVSYLDKPAALALPRVAKAFTPIADHAIWHRLSLRPISSDGGTGEEDDLPEDALCSAILLEDELRDHLDRVFRKATRRTWGLVQHITLYYPVGPPPSSHLVDIILAASASIRSLRANMSELGPAMPPLHRPTLDSILIDSVLSGLPMLRHVDFGLRIIDDANFIRHLCDLAPELDSLFVCIDDKFRPTKRSDCPNPSRRATKLRQLRRLYCEVEADSLVGVSSPGPASVPTPITAFISLLDRSNHLKLLWMEYSPSGRYPLEPLISAISRAAPSDLCWPQMGSEAFQGVCEKSPDGSTRVVMDYGDYVMPPRLRSCLPTVHTLYLEQLAYPSSHISNTLKFTCFPLSAGIHGIDPDFSAWIRRCPRLVRIFCVQALDSSDSLSSGLDNLEARVTPTVTEYGSGEILHAQIRVEDVIVLDRTDYFSSPGDPIWPIWKRVLHIDAGDGCAEEIQPRVAERKAPVTRTYTDFEGHTIPSGILRKMSEVEVLSQDREGRNVEVGDEAWRILEDWVSLQNELSQD